MTAGAPEGVARDEQINFKVPKGTKARVQTLAMALNLSMVEAFERAIQMLEASLPKGARNDRRTNRRSITGLILVAAAANGTVTATGGYGTPQSYYTLAMALGVAVGAATIGRAHSLALIVAIGVGMFCGETYALLGTADRVVTAAEAAQAPLRDAARRHQLALDELTAAEAAKRMGAGGGDGRVQAVSASVEIKAVSTRILQRLATGCR